MKGVGLWETTENLRTATAKFALFSLKGVGLWDERCKLYLKKTPLC